MIWRKEFAVLQKFLSWKQTMKLWSDAIKKHGVHTRSLLRATIRRYRTRERLLLSELKGRAQFIYNTSP